MTGIPELDVVLKGGFPAGRVHLVEGRPGTGKTTLGLRFLVDGAAQGDSCLYVTLSETAAELRASAASHGWDLDGVEVVEIRLTEERLERQQSVFASGEFGLGSTVAEIVSRIQAARPQRVVVDSMAELRLMAEDPMRYRRQVMALRHHLQSFGGTALLLSDTSDPDEYDLQALVHGVVSLEMIERHYGAARRRLRVVKLRGAEFQSGWHDFAIQRGELLVFPSLIADEHRRDFEPADETTGVEALDHLLGGGLGRGSTTMLIGPSGVGKSSLAMHCLVAATRRGHHAACFSFDESDGSVLQRARALGLDFEEQVQGGKLYWERANPSRISPGEFVWKVRRQVEDHDARVVVIDSMNSYLETMPEERALMLQMHELLTYLSNQGVVVLLILAQKGVVGSVENPIDLSFLSDTLVLMRFFEEEGEIRKAITVVKKRNGSHRVGVHRFDFGEGGVCIELDRLQHGALAPVGTADHAAAR
jgi:circadian clock protein KaiC